MCTKRGVGVDSAGISHDLSTAFHRAPAIDPPVRLSAMRQLLPTPQDEVDPLDLYLRDERHRRDNRPWVMANMVASADGAISIDGVSGGLGGEGDALVFRAIRASCDWIVAAAGTVRAERYRLPTPNATAPSRVAAGRAAAPRLAVVTESVELPSDLPLLAERHDDTPKALIITGANPPSTAVERIGDRAEWCHLSTERPTPPDIIDALNQRGADVVLLEGGPNFNGQMVDAGLVDELCLSISPHLVGGSSTRIVAGSTTAIPADLTLERVLEHDGALFVRYTRR